MEYILCYNIVLVPAVQHESGISMPVSPPFAASLPLPKSPYI